MLDRIQLKREAKEITRNAQVSAYLVALIYLVIVNVLSMIDTYVSGSLVADLQTLQLYYPEVQIQVPEFLLAAARIPGTVTVFVTVMVALLTAVLNAGWVLYHQGVRRGEVMGYGTLFDGFAFVGKVILLNLVISVFITLWTFALIIPGIIATYRYRFAVYNLCENPEMGVMEAMRMSSAQTYGHKMDLFVLDLTFFGWELLCSLTMGILSIWIAPYILQTNLGYFQQIKQMKGIGWFPPQEGADDTGFCGQDPFGPNA